MEIIEFISKSACLKTYPKKRKCKHPHCKTTLNIYNGNDYCLYHTFKRLSLGLVVGSCRRLLVRKPATEQHRRNISNGMKRSWNEKK